MENFNKIEKEWHIMLIKLLIVYEVQNFADNFADYIKSNNKYRSKFESLFL